MGEQVLDGDETLGRDESLCGLELDALEGGHVFLDRVVQLHFAFFDEHHHGHRGHRLRHRGDPEHRVLAHRPLLRDVRQAKGFDGDQSVGTDDRGDGAGDDIVFHEMLQRERGHRVLIIRHRLLFLAAGQEEEAKGKAQ